MLLDSLGIDKPELLLNQSCETPLHSALSSKSNNNGSRYSLELIQRLCTRETADIVDTKSKNTPLHVLCRNPESVTAEAAAWIIEHSNLSRTDSSGRSALHLIFRNADKGSNTSKIASKLLEKHPSMMATKDSESRIPLRFLADTAFFFDNNKDQQGNCYY